MTHDWLRLAVVGLAALIAAALAPVRAPAQVTTERGASILVFPKVLADVSGDTVVQLANLSDNSIDAYCAHVDGAAEPAAITRLLHRARIASSGAPSAAAGRPGERIARYSAAPSGFRGELLCRSMAPAHRSRNELAGQATLVDLASGDVAA